MRRFLLFLAVCLPLFVLVSSAEDIYRLEREHSPLTDSAASYLAAAATPGYAYKDGILNRVVVSSLSGASYLPVSGDFSTVMRQVLSVDDNAQVFANAVAPYVNDPEVLNVLKGVYQMVAGRVYGSSAAGLNVLERWGDILQSDGTVGLENSYGLADIVSNGFMGLRSLGLYSGTILRYDGVLTRVSNYDLPRLISNGFQGLSVSLLRNVSYLTDSGYVSGSPASMHITDVLSSGLLGLSSNLAGSDKVTAFTILSSSDITEDPEEVEVGNILDAIAQLHNSLQPDLAKLRFVLASDEDIQMREDLKENYDAVNDTFMKPGSSGSVSVGDISDMGSVSHDASQLVNTGVSVGTAFGQLKDPSIFSFFTQDAASDLDRVPVTAADDDPDIWAPSLWEQQQAQFYSIVGWGGE